MIYLIIERMANDIGPTTVCLEDGEPFYGNKHVEKKRRRNHRLLSHHNLSTGLLASFLTSPLRKQAFIPSIIFTTPDSLAGLSIPPSPVGKQPHWLPQSSINTITKGCHFSLILGLFYFKQNLDSLHDLLSETTTGKA